MSGSAGHTSVGGGTVGGGLAPATPAGNSLGLQKLAEWDRTMGCISLLMWGGTAVKVFPLLSPSENVQSMLGMIAIFAVVVAWPTLSMSSYLRWRIPALAFLRVVLFALPFNFSTQVFDAIAPDVNTGRLALVSNLFQLFMSIRIALLTFTSLGWRVPFRLHLVLQALNVAMLIRFGLHPYCRSKLLSSPELESTAAAVHSLMAFVAMIFVPSTAIIVPESVYAQRIAFLLFCWVLLGWLLPTLLLLPEAEDDVPRQRPLAPGASRWDSPLANRLAGVLESWLRLLVPARQARQRQPAGALALPASASCLVYWWAVVLVAWGACCTAAPLFAVPV